MNKTLFYLLTTVCAAPAWGQAVPVSAASSASGIYWTLGGLAPTTTAVSADGNTILTQGILQTPFSALSGTSAISADDKGVSVVVVNNSLRIICGGTFSWSLTSPAGITVASGLGNEFAETEIRNSESGTYIISIIDGRRKRTVKKFILK